MSVSVNFIGEALLGKIIKSIDVGKQYYACENDIVIYETGQMYINLNGLATEEDDEVYMLPIKKTGPEEYLIDLSVDYVFTPLTEKVDIHADKTKDFIGPFAAPCIPTSDLEEYKRWTLDDLKEELDYCEEDEEFERIKDLKMAISHKKAEAKM